MNSPSRRDVIAGAILTFVEIPTVASAQPVDSAVIENWMEAWMSEQRSTIGTLHLSRFVEPVYFLLKPTMWLPDAAQQGRLSPVTVPIGFVTDFASIPSIFWSLLRPDGQYTHPAIVHDYLYWTQTTSREAADEILRIMMEDFAVPKAEVTTIYHAVRVGGAAAWSGNAKARGAGEKRVLRRFPDDPRTKWADWKRLPDVFE